MVVEIGVGVGVGVTVTMIVVSLMVELLAEKVTGVDVTSVLLVEVTKLELGFCVVELYSVVVEDDKLGVVGISILELGIVVNPEGELDRDGALEELGTMMLLEIDDVISPELMVGDNVATLELTLAVLNELGMTWLDDGVEEGVGVGVGIAELERAIFW